MFSSTTILSSITRPIATVMPPRVIMFNVKPCQFSKAKAAKTESGIDTADTRVDRTLKFKNTRITMTAKSAPSAPSRTTPLMDSSMKPACSNTVSKRISGISPINSSSSSSTRCTTATVLASRVLLTLIPRLGLPLVRLMVEAGGVAAISAVAPTNCVCRSASSVSRKAGGSAASVSGGRANNVSGVSSSNICGTNCAMVCIISGVTSAVVSTGVPCAALDAFQDSGSATGSAPVAAARLASPA